MDVVNRGMRKYELITNCKRVSYRKISIPLSLRESIPKHIKRGCLKKTASFDVTELEIFIFG